MQKTFFELLPLFVEQTDYVIRKYTVHIVPRFDARVVASAKNMNVDNSQLLLVRLFKKMFPLCLRNDSGLCNNTKTTPITFF